MQLMGRKPGALGTVTAQEALGPRALLGDMNRRAFGRAFEGDYSNVTDAETLDAIVYPTSTRRPGLIAGPPDPPGTPSATNIANLTGYPDLIVPAGFTSDRLPVTISFFGTAYSEPRLTYSP